MFLGILIGFIPAGAGAGWIPGQHASLDMVYPRGRGRGRGGLGRDDMILVVCLIPAIVWMLLRCCRVSRFKGFVRG